jgi:hypothetical protein
VEAGNHDNPMLLNFAQYAVGKTPHSSTAMVPVDDWKLQWMFRDSFHPGLDGQRETFP